MKPANIGTSNKNMFVNLRWITNSSQFHIMPPTLKSVSDYRDASQVVLDKIGITKAQIENLCIDDTYAGVGTRHQKEIA